MFGRRRKKKLILVARMLRELDAAATRSKPARRRKLAISRA